MVRVSRLVFLCSFGRLSLELTFCIALSIYLIASASLDFIFLILGALNCYGTTGSAFAKIGSVGLLGATFSFCLIYLVTLVGFWFCFGNEEIGRGVTSSADDVSPKKPSTWPITGFLCLYFVSLGEIAFFDWVEESLTVRADCGTTKLLACFVYTASLFFWCTFKQPASSSFRDNSSIF
jgi:hypothetical protein